MDFVNKIKQSIVNVCIANFALLPVIECLFIISYITYGKQKPDKTQDTNDIQTKAWVLAIAR